MLRESASPMKEPQQMKGKEKKKNTPIEREFRDANHSSRRWESVVRRVCFHNEHVSFAATNPIENGGAEYLGPSLVSKARKPGCGIAPGTQSENRSVALCQVVRGSCLTTFFYYCVSVLFSLICPSLLFCESVLLFALSEKSMFPRSCRDRSACSRQHDRADGAVGKRTCQLVAGASGSRKTRRQAKTRPRAIRVAIIPSYEG